MKTTLSGCGAGCEIDWHSLTDVRYWGKADIAYAR